MDMLLLLVSLAAFAVLVVGWLILPAQPPAAAERGAAMPAAEAA